jgi:prephenate dehydrogenase
LNVAVLGLGLIGGSVGLAARASGCHVIGFDPDPAVLSSALQAGAIDEVASVPERALANAEVVILAAPIGALAEMARLALRHAPEDCVVSDVGSTKRSLLRALQAEPGVERLIGGHPLAGSEQAGIEHARADLFNGAFWCLMPAKDGVLARRLRSLIEALGARPIEIEPEAHDEAMARISHLPHVLANTLIAGTAGFGASERALASGGPSFRDATRVAGANSAIWTDIYLSNADMLITAIDEAIGELRALSRMLSDGDASALTNWNERARDQRARLLP